MWTLSMGILMKKLLYGFIVLACMPMLHGMKHPDDTSGLSDNGFVVMEPTQKSKVTITNTTHWHIKVNCFDADNKEQYRIIESNKHEIFNADELKGSVTFSGVAARAYISLYP